MHNTAQLFICRWLYPANGDYVTWRLPRATSRHRQHKSVRTIVAVVVQCIKMWSVQYTNFQNPIPVSQCPPWPTTTCTKSTKYLGTTIHSDLKWNPHIEIITGKAICTVGLLRWNLQVRNVKIKEKAYMSLVCPQVEFTRPVWDPHTRTLVHRVEMVQRRDAYYVCCWYHNPSSVSSMLEEVGWRSLEMCHQDDRLTMMYIE